MANQRLNATVTIGGALSASVGKAIGGLKSGLKDVAGEIKSVTSRQKELSKQRKVLEREGRSVEALDREYEDLGRTLEALRRKQERYERAAAASARVGRDFRGAVGEIGRVSRNAGIAVGVTAGAVFGLASSTAELGDQVAKNADKFGMGIDAYQELRYAAERSGVSISTFDSSMTAFVKRLGEAKDGSGPAADALEALGLKISDIIEMKPEDALAKISDELEKVENPAERAAIMADLFSRAGVGMVNMLRMGSDNLQQLRRDAQATGYVLSNEAARDAETFQDRLLDAQLVVKGLKNVIGAEFMPVVTDAMERFSGWARTNRGDIEAFASAAADRLETLAPIIGDVLSGVTKVGTQVGSMLGTVADLVGGWENLGIVIGAALGVRTAMKIGGLLLSVGKLASALVSLTGTTALVGRAFGTMRQQISTEVAASAAAAEAAGARMRTALNIRGALLAANLGIAALQIPDTAEGVGAMINRNRERTEEGLRNAPLIGGMMRAYEGAVDWVHGSDEPAPADGPPAPSFGPTPPAPARPETRPAPGRPVVRPGDEVQRRARGGPFRKGWRLVGEEGPELEFMSRTGFIATARETRRLADLAMRARSSLDGALERPRAVPRQVVLGSIARSDRAAVKPADLSMPDLSGVPGALMRAMGAIDASRPASDLPVERRADSGAPAAAPVSSARASDRRGNLMAAVGTLVARAPAVPRRIGARLASAATPAVPRRVETRLASVAAPAPLDLERRLASIGDGISAAVERPSVASESAGVHLPRVPEASRTAPAPRSAASVTQNITINAAGMSVERLFAELERRRRDAASAALYDGVTDFGQYGRGFV